MLPQGFIDLAEAIPGIRTDVRYATCRNLTGHPLAGYRAGKAIATLQVAEALKTCFDEATQMGCGLLIFDAYRPQKAVDDFVRWSQQPEDETQRKAYYPTLRKEDLFPLGYIAAKSGHSRGSTIDLTLTDASGQPLDMGTDFDFMDDLSHHGAMGLTEHQQENRRLLLSIMEKGGFVPYENEWWHYRLRNEPYPDTYFDFDIL